jgi:hypothetical protein
MNIDLITAIVGSSVIAAIVTAYFTKLINDKKNIIENVVKERKKWRDRIREIVQETSDIFEHKSIADLNNIKSQLTVLLNPMDKSDIAILESLNKIKESWEINALEEFNDRVSYLLKHDWDRVKIETNTSVSYQSLLVASVWLAIYFSIVTDILNKQPSITAIALCVSLLFALPLFSKWTFLLVRDSELLGLFIRVKEPESVVAWLENKAYRFKYIERKKR